ncbi:cyclic GMP-AMP synthase-like receptor 1 [Crassostrea virginica]
MHHIPRMSEVVYVGMCRYVGYPTEVRIRREVTDTVEAVWRPVWIRMGFDRMESGSRREGFRLKTSDLDYMFWPPDHKVICDLSQISLYRIPQHTVILMECEDLPPGFTRLKLMTPSGDQNVNSSLIACNNEIYISSFLYRAKMLELQQAAGGIAMSSIQHGPCATINHNGREADCAYCLRSHHWPNIALPWIQRCQLKNWPPDYVLSSIIKDGCHVVPISSSLLNPESGCDWRMSFSRAEQQLVNSMNHCQFLCYGLLKLFLKEVINSTENESCLCSYFMKTVVFWVIQNDNHMAWVPENLLMCFWTCFKLLISWVHRGECPNFFIPQNNMFRVKVVGQNQIALFDQLYGLYCKGISSFFVKSNNKTIPVYADCRQNTDIQNR